VNLGPLGLHNVVFVATENDSVYAYDADTLALLWHDSFINPAAGITPVPAADVKAFDVTPVIGITGTPVIDAATSTLYVVDKVKDSSSGKPVYAARLHALDLATGAEKDGGPVNLQAVSRGRGDGSVRGRITFSPLWEFQRSGLLLDNGTVYVAFASQGDNGPYHGWVLGYNAQTLQQVASFNATPNGKAGGIWMSGGAIASDAAHNLFLATGNGTFDANRGGKNVGDSVLKLSGSTGLKLLDYFTPSNEAALKSADLDLGAGGTLLLPDQPGAHPHMLLAGGKEGTLYLVDRDNLGRFNRRKNRVVEEMHKAVSGSFSTPAYFNSTVYLVGSAPQGDAPGGEVLQAFSLANGVLLPNPTKGAYTYGYPGSTPSISANGTASGIVWTLDNGGWQSQQQAILRAYDATNVTRELYDSTQAGARDQGGPAVKFTVPTVVNGKVYVGGGGTLTVYGLLPAR
jgi:hypothetical protein